MSDGNLQNCTETKKTLSRTFEKANISSKFVMDVLEKFRNNFGNYY